MRKGEQENPAEMDVEKLIFTGLSHNLPGTKKFIFFIG